VPQNTRSDSRLGLSLARIAERIRCPNYGDLGVMLAFDVPGSPIPVFRLVQFGRGG